LEELYSKYAFRTSHRSRHARNPAADLQHSRGRPLSPGIGTDVCVRTVRRLALPRLHADGSQRSALLICVRRRRYRPRCHASNSIALLGAAGNAPNYPEVERAFRDATGADLGRATWHGWWHGQRLPNATYRTLVDNALDGLATRWLYRSLEHDRLQAHLCALDLKWLAAHQPTVARAEAWEMLWTLHRDWAPSPTGEIALPSLIRNPRRTRRKKGKPDSRSTSFGRRKGVPAPLKLRATDLGVSAHEPLNPSSILLFLMRYAFESALPDPGLKEAFVLDFLTGAAAAACLVQIIAPERIDDWGLPGRIFSAMRPHFWPIADDEQAGLDALFVAYIEPLLKMTATTCPDKEALEFLRELKAAYYDSLGVTGLSEQELQAFASANLCGSNRNVWRASVRRRDLSRSSSK
jgi:hypothetical protein